MEVNNEHVIRGNSAVVKCSIPSFVADFVSVWSWNDNSGNEYSIRRDHDENHSKGGVVASVIVWFLLVLKKIISRRRTFETINRNLGICLPRVTEPCTERICWSYVVRLCTELFSRCLLIYQKRRLYYLRLNDTLFKVVEIT